MKYPTIHMNGTGRDALVQGYLDCVGALDDALKALGETMPHGRDYYIQGPGALTAAGDEWFMRREKLLSVRRDMVSLAHYCAGLPYEDQDRISMPGDAA